MKETFDEKLARVAGTVRQVVMDDPHLRREGSLLHYLSKARSLHDSALSLANDQTGDHFDAFALLAGFSIEVLLKGTLVGLRQKIPFTHNLVKLADEAGIGLSTDDRVILASLTVYTTWKSRYPAAKGSRETMQGLEALILPIPLHGTLDRVFRAIEELQVSVTSSNYERVYEFLLRRFFDVHSSVRESATLSWQKSQD